MNTIENNEGQPSYLLGNDRVTAHVTVQGGHITAAFHHPQNDFRPFFTAPWWREADLEATDEIIKVLRGDFFCLPFGANEDPYQGTEHPVHGRTSNDCWGFAERDENDREKTLRLNMDLGPGGGNVEKIIRLRADDPVIYSEHVINGLGGKMPLGHHATLQCPDELGAGIIDMSEPITGFTTPVPVEEPASRGYSLLKVGTEISDRSRVPCVDGTLADLTRYPTRRGFEDVVAFISDTSKEFVFTTASFPEEGYVFFQLKDPKVLSQTLFWLSNGGRHYPPWNGRITAVLGMEEVTSFFHYGLKPSVEPNFFHDKGFRSYVDFDQNKPTSIKVIMGLVPVEKTFQGVQDIVRSSDTEITILGRGGERIAVSCAVDFLKA
ncbi:MAG: hypothetical protein V3V75_10645 [Thermoguttaceae bacterium]